MTGVGLTSRASELLVFIAGYQRATGGSSPTFRQMQAALGASSTGNVHALMRQLEERGRVRRPFYGHRAIEVLQQPSIPLIDMRSPERHAHWVWNDEDKRLVPMARGPIRE